MNGYEKGGSLAPRAAGIRSHVRYADRIHAVIFVVSAQEADADVEGNYAQRLRFFVNACNQQGQISKQKTNSALRQRDAENRCRRKICSRCCVCINSLTLVMFVYGSPRFVSVSPEVPFLLVATKADELVRGPAAAGPSPSSSSSSSSSSGDDGTGELFDTALLFKDANVVTTVQRIAKHTGVPRGQVSAKQSVGNNQCETIRLSGRTISAKHCNQWENNQCENNEWQNNQCAARSSGGAEQRAPGAAGVGWARVGGPLSAGADRSGWPLTDCPPAAAARPVHTRPQHLL